MAVQIPNDMAVGASQPWNYNQAVQALNPQVMNSPQQVAQQQLMQQQGANPAMANQIGYDSVGNPISASDWNRGFRGQQPNQPVQNMQNGTQPSSNFYPSYPQPYQQQMEGLFSKHINRLSDLYDPSKTGIEPILANTTRKFRTQVLPGLAEKFTAMGGSGSHAGSNFLGQVSGASAGLESNLAALQAGHHLAERSQLTNALQRLNPYEQVYQQGQQGSAPQQQSTGMKWVKNLLKAGGAAAAGAVGGFLSPVPGGAAAGAIGGAVSSLINSITEGDVITGDQIGQVYSQLRATPGPNKNENGITNEQQAFLDELSKRAGQPVTPEEVQKIQAIVGGVGAAEDFQRTQKQPGSQLTYAQRLKARKAAARQGAV